MCGILGMLRLPDTTQRRRLAAREAVAASPSHRGSGDRRMRIDRDTRVALEHPSHKDGATKMAR